MVTTSPGDLVAPKAASFRSVRAALNRFTIRPCYVGRFHSLVSFHDVEFNCLPFAGAPPSGLLWVASHDGCMVDVGVVAVDEVVFLFNIIPFNGSYQSQVLLRGGMHQCSFQVRSPVSECLESFVDFYTSLISTSPSHALNNAYSSIVFFSPQDPMTWVRPLNCWRL